MLSLISALLLLTSAQKPLVGTHPMQSQLLATHQMSLNDRYDNASVNAVFKDNILLNLAYLRGVQQAGTEINWNNVRAPFSYDFVLRPGETFAFHDQVLSQYSASLTKTTNAHFNSTEGFKSDGYLVGDGVCHLASLIYYSAKDSGLATFAPTNHDFAKINEIPKEYGVAIYTNAASKEASANENLYITNDKSNPVEFKFDFDGNNLQVSTIELQ